MFDGGYNKYNITTHEVKQHTKCIDKMIFNTACFCYVNSSCSSAYKVCGQQIFNAARLC